jgi:tellurite resistance protein TerC
MIWIWAGFILFVLLMLALDLGVFHRNAHVVSIREALGWSALWIGLGLAFSVFVYYGYEHQWMGLGLAVDAVDGQLNDGASATVKYLTGYVIEKSLSVDNVFVIAMIFAFMAVPRLYQHRVLFWGILGALVMRGVMIAIGAELIARYHWIEDARHSGTWRSGTEHRGAMDQEVVPGYQSVPRRAFRRARRVRPIAEGCGAWPGGTARHCCGPGGAWHIDADTIGAVAHRGGDDGPDFRSGLDPRDLRHHR